MTTILEKIKDSVEQGHYKVTEQLINQALKKTHPRSAHCRGKYGSCHAADGGKL